MYHSPTTTVIQQSTNKILWVIFHFITLLISLIIRLFLRLLAHSTVITQQLETICQISKTVNVFLEHVFGQDLNETDQLSQRCYQNLPISIVTPMVV